MVHFLGSAHALPRTISLTFDVDRPNSCAINPVRTPASAIARIFATFLGLSFFARFGLVVACLKPIWSAAWLFSVGVHQRRFSARLSALLKFKWSTHGFPSGFGMKASATSRWIDVCTALRSALLSATWMYPFRLTRPFKTWPPADHLRERTLPQSLTSYVGNASIFFHTVISGAPPVLGVDSVAGMGG
jgi:hypothetical protein